MLRYMIANGTTPDDVSWAWPRVPFASSEPNATVYGGFADNGSGSGDGLGVLETDKVGGLGWAYLTVWKVTKRDTLLEAAKACADALAKNVQPGNATFSPWPFRVHAKTGEVQEVYTANTVWSIRLFDDLLSLPPRVELSAEARARYEGAREIAWRWQSEFPMRNGNWCGYHEDITTKQAWRGGVVGQLPCNYNSMTPLLLARYLLQPRVGQPVAGPAASTLADARALLSFVETHLIYWSVGDPGPAKNQPAVAWGARCVSEQKADKDRMGRHTTRYASVLALYADVLRRQEGANASTLNTSRQLADMARRSWNWASYCLTGSSQHRLSSAPMPLQQPVPLIVLAVD